ncbi:hypothetical protein AK830_g223 [Neonectria ditissima]|uniref:Uncharacterized protein n=1 Tax=Neonectria ditissima TaxID=78410 RepID=A0A0P7BQS5_9HYPO|nr:hypothetical protein AK830_g223 [Neonectria ditissima]
MLGSLKHYFEYVLRGGCGFPSVTLLGEQSDWESIIVKARNLARYGAETTEWARLLDPVLRHMVRSFESPDSYSTRDFWMRACYQAGREGSGAKATLSGWITAFCLWNEDGKRNGVYTIERLEDEDRNCGLPVVDRRQLVLDGVPYPLLSQDSVPKAFVYIPLVLEDYATDIEYTATVVAGHVGVAVTEERTTVQPLSGWWMLQDSMKPSSR